jgi:benzodiazapine receptor
MTSETLARAPRRSGWGLVGFILAVAAVAAAGSAAAIGAADHYNQLRRPVWGPPSWLFGPVWTVLYAMIAYSGWRAWKRSGFGMALWVYAVQLALNAAWTPVFFGADRYGLAIVIIAGLWLAIAVNIILFRRIDPTAAWLLVPYWMWVSFAAALNIAVWWMNR